MNISVKELKRFRDLSEHVKGSNILPAHKYLKIGNGIISKNVNSSFISYNCAQADESPLLVQEDDLFSLVSETFSPFISINKVKGKIELKDDKDVIRLQCMPDNTFNDLPVATEEKIELSPEFWQAAFKASHFAQFVKDAPTYYGYVHIGQNCVCGGDGIIAFHCAVEESVKLIIEGKIAQSLSKYKVFSLSQNENNYFFESPDVIIGFVKPAIGWLDIRSLFKRDMKYSFSLGASDVLSFDNLAIKLTPDPMVTITTGQFEMNDMLLDKNHKREVANVKISGEFTYNPKLMNTVLKALDIEEIDFSENESAYYLNSKEDTGTALIAKINKK